LLFENYGQEVGETNLLVSNLNVWGTSLRRSLRLLRLCNEDSTEDESTELENTIDVSQCCAILSISRERACLQCKQKPSCRWDGHAVFRVLLSILWITLTFILPRTVSKLEWSGLKKMHWFSILSMSFC